MQHCRLAVVLPTSTTSLKHKRNEANFPDMARENTNPKRLSVALEGTKASNL